MRKAVVPFTILNLLAGCAPAERYRVFDGDKTVRTCYSDGTCEPPANQPVQPAPESATPAKEEPPPADAAARPRSMVGSCRHACPCGKSDEAKQCSRDFANAVDAAVAFLEPTDKQRVELVQETLERADASELDRLYYRDRIARKIADPYHRAFWGEVLLTASDFARYRSPIERAFMRRLDTGR